MAYSELKPDEHVSRSMAAVEKCHAEHKKWRVPAPFRSLALPEAGRGI